MHRKTPFLAISFKIIICFKSLNIVILVLKLANRLETNRAGCRTGTKFCGALAYADDLTLISPSIKGLQSMINICETFSVEYDVVFNETKTVCIMFGKNEVTPVVYMSNVKLVWKLKVKHLGNIINSDLSDNDDIKYKCGVFLPVC